MQDFTEFVTIIRDSILKCGISSSIYTFSEIGFGYQQAMLALRIGNGIRPTIWMYRFEDYAVQLFLLETMYRLDKIITLTGLDYDNLAEMEYVLLSIHVLRLVRKGHSGMPSFLPATRQWESFEEKKD